MARSCRASEVVVAAGLREAALGVFWPGYVTLYDALHEKTHVLLGELVHWGLQASMPRCQGPMRGKWKRCWRKGART